MSDTISPIIPQGPFDRSLLRAPITPVPQTPMQRVVGSTTAGIEVALQSLLRVTAEIAQGNRAEAENPNPPVRQFKNAPITYDGNGNASRRAPTEMASIFLSV